MSLLQNTVDVAPTQRMSIPYEQRSVDSSALVQNRLAFPKSGWCPLSKIVTSCKFRCDKTNGDGLVALKDYGTSALINSFTLNMGDSEVLEQRTSANIVSKILYDLRSGAGQQDSMVWAFGAGGTHTSRSGAQRVAAGSEPDLLIHYDSGFCASPELFPFHFYPQIFKYVYYNSAGEALISSATAGGEQWFLSQLEGHFELATMDPAYEAAARARVAEKGFRKSYKVVDVKAEKLDAVTKETLDVGERANNVKALWCAIRTNSNITSPQQVEMKFVQDDLKDLQLRIGSYNYPQRPVRQGAESLRMMLEAHHINIHQSETPSLITRDEYIGGSATKVSYGFNLEKFKQPNVIAGVDAYKTPLTLEITTNATGFTPNSRLYMCVVKDHTLLLDPSRRISILK